MIEVSQPSSARERVAAFLWQHLWLVISLFIMTFGVALCLRSNLGSSVISTIPFVMTIAGENSLAPTLTIGEYTYIMNFLLVVIQVLILRRKFEPIQLLQLLIGFVFGFLLDINVGLTQIFANVECFWGRAILQIGGCIVLAFGITMEIHCGSITMPGEGVPAALSKAFNLQFAKAKIGVDILLVVVAVILGYIFFDSWMWQVVGPGTLLAMVLVGFLVKIFNKHIAWFNTLLDYRPGIGRFIYGLARYMLNKK